MGKEARVDNGIIGTGEHVIGALARWRGSAIALVSGVRGPGIAADAGRRAPVIVGLSQRDLGSGNFAHVAVLTGLASLARRGVLELGEGLLESKPIQQIHVVATATESGGGNRVELDDVPVNLSLPLGIFLGFESRIGSQEFLEDGVSPRTVNGLVDIPGHHCGPSADFPIIAIHPVTHHAGDPFK